MTAAMLGTVASAQETYDNAPLAQKDLNGTARYVGMGGAMEALGADVSTMGTNPAGIGMFRRSVVNGSFGFNSQSEAESFNGADKTNMSFDQAGFVYSMRTSRSSFINFGFSYTKSKNFAQILSATDKLNGASQNKLSAMKNLNGIYKFDGSNGLNAKYATYSQVDHLYSNVLFNHYDADNASAPSNAVLNNGVIVKESSPTTPVYFNATDYQFGRATSGYIGEYNFNISGNSNDRFYWGLTFGLYDVHYNGSSDYAENLVEKNNTKGNILKSDDRKITGTGFDIKGGIIFRPVEESPFRVGLYVHTPTWYDLTTKNYTTLDISNLNKGYGSINKDKSYESYDFKFYTPWRFGVSLGHTVGNYLAIGATYEYADYSTCDIRINDGGEVDEWG